jgi:hypothetical protein
MRRLHQDAASRPPWRDDVIGTAVDLFWGSQVGEAGDHGQADSLAR